MGNTKVPLATDTQVTANSRDRRTACSASASPSGGAFLVPTYNGAFQMNATLTLAALLTFSTSLFAFIPNHIGWLAEATAKQCKTHAWPAANHQTMIAWCVHNKYPVK